MNTLELIAADPASVSPAARLQSHYFVTFDSVLGVLSEASKLLTANLLCVSEHSDTGDDHERCLTLKFADDEDNLIHDAIQTLKDDDTLTITINYMNLRKTGAFGGEVVRFHRLLNCQIERVRYGDLSYHASGAEDEEPATIMVDVRFDELKVEKV